MVCQYCHIQENIRDWNTFLSAVFASDGFHDLTDCHMSVAIKAAAKTIHNPSAKGIPIERIDTPSLHTGGVNALFLIGYSDT
jgi:hypothetical protein